MKRIILLTLCTSLLPCVSSCNYAQDVTLTPDNNHVCVTKSGSVTFQGPGLTLEEIAKEEGLTHKHGRTYQAAVVFSTAFNGGHPSRGKIFNCTDKVLKYECLFYDGTRLLGSYQQTVKPRTFSRMVPDEIDLSELSTCNRIVCSEM